MGRVGLGRGVGAGFVLVRGRGCVGCIFGWGVW